MFPLKSLARGLRFAWLARSIDDGKIIKAIRLITLSKSHRRLCGGTEFLITR